MNDQTPPADGRITFLQHRLPGLKAGEYRLTIEQAVTTADGCVNDRFVSQTKFFVAGHRFQLDPADIDSVFPPAAMEGSFLNVLPHVVLTNRTLPWERSPLGAAAVKTGESPNDIASWLALLLFDSFDPAPELRTMKVADLVPKAHDPAGTLPDCYLSYPNLGQLEPGESYGDACQVIDVPVALFNAIAPTLADLDWLAHARKVDKKPLAAAAPAPAGVADYAVVVGSRLPRRGRGSTVHLVSLDHLGLYLPTAAGPSAAIPPGTTTVRLVSLKSWSFDTTEEKRTFEGLLKAADCGALQPQAQIAGDAPAEQTLRNALAMGYTALDHHPRLGGHMVSWYRGPLVPLRVRRRVTTPIESSDAVMQYDSDTGLFDVSYAAAWQLGQLLGIQNQEFADALFSWKLANKRETIERAERVLLGRQIAGEGGPVQNEAIVNAALELVRASLASVAVGEKAP